MKICIDLTSIYDKLTGIEKFALNIAKHMLLNDNKNNYILLFKKELHHDFEFIKTKENVKYYLLNINNKLVLDQIILPLYLYINKSDVYLFISFPSPILFFSQRIVNTVFDMTPWLFPNTMSMKGLLYFKSLILIAVKRSKLILTISSNSKKDILRFFKCTNIEIIYCGVDSIYKKINPDRNFRDNLREKYNLPLRYILCIGTLEPRKNLNLLIDAFINLRNKKIIEQKLVLVGRKGWKYNSIYEKVTRNNLQNDVILTGYVGEKDLPYIYYYADFFVFPSLYEGFGIPPLEAMAVGVPVLCSDSSSLPEVVGNRACTFKNNNLDDLEYKLEEFINLTDTQRRELINFGKERASLFNWDNESIKLISILENKFLRR